MMVGFWLPSIHLFCWVEMPSLPACINWFVWGGSNKCERVWRNLWSVLKPRSSDRYSNWVLGHPSCNPGNHQSITSRRNHSAPLGGWVYPSCIIITVHTGTTELQALFQSNMVEGPSTMPQSCDLSSVVSPVNMEYLCLLWKNSHIISQITLEDLFLDLPHH